MRGIVLTLLLLFSLTITQANETDIKSLVSEFHVCLNEGNVNEANDIYEQLRKTVPAYIGYYRDVTAMYMSVCTEQLGIDIGPEDINKLYDMRISGKSKRILHIATHGFYDRNGIRQDEALDDAKALSYSGLCMSGANNIYKGEDFPENIDDGILTALEISELDMRGMELVVLSACQTGQGVVTNDGVFGLQRGFKKAGVKSILMSLWEVDDEATCVLMTEFYKNLVDGRSKHKALELAKRAVREQKDKGWDDPYYWASFILLDGVESGK